MGLRNDWDNPQEKVQGGVMGTINPKERRNGENHQRVDLMNSQTLLGSYSLNVFQLYWGIINNKKKLHGLDVYILVSLDICINLWSHYHKQVNKYIHHFPPPKDFMCPLGFFFIKNIYLKIYPLNKLLSVHRIANHRHYVIQQNSRAHSSPMTVTLHSLNNGFSFPSPCSLETTKLFSAS